MTNLFRYIALRHLKMKPGRTTLAVMGIACGIALYVAISIINDSTSGFFKDSMTAVSGKATLQISAGDLGFDEKIADTIEKIEGVKDAVPVIETRSWLLSTNESVMVLGVDLLQEKAVRSYKDTGKKIMGDAIVFMSRPDSLILTDTYRHRHAQRRERRRGRPTHSRRHRPQLQRRPPRNGVGSDGTHGGIVPVHVALFQHPGADRGHFPHRQLGFH
ncbi:MAG: ABC transporter permease [Deltaproteobacteria bacterium]|nr:ABC transporter permease [Deltaproteobacteria bacterium]